MSSCSGLVLDLLGYDQADLLGTGWRIVLPRSSVAETVRMMRDMARRRGGVYRLLNVSRGGDCVHLRIVTFVVAGDTTIRGIAVLEEWLPNRRRVLLPRSPPDERRASQAR